MLETIWQEFLKIVREEVGSRVVETWFKAVSIASWDSHAKTVFLTAPNTFVTEWILSHYQSLLQQHLARLLNQDIVNVRFIGATTNEQHMRELSVRPAISAEASSSSMNRGTLTKNVNKVASRALYQFDNFICGPHNALAYAAARATAERPGVHYNPLFMYGNSGLGKTHLLHAISNYISAAHPQARVVYQSAERFVNEFIGAIRFNTMSTFETKYKSIDVLLIDDIQFISRKEQTQEAFFHIFNTLYEARKQIVLSSDSLPSDISGLADRLRSRLEGGLVVDIQLPTLETKVAILKKKAELQHEVLSDDVAYLIASRSIDNIRELEGLLLRVCAFASLTHQPISADLVKKILAPTASDVADDQPVTMQFVAAKVASHYKTSVLELRSPKRNKQLTQARHVAMYLMKKLTTSTCADIGVFWCRKDHSTVVHALEKIEKSRELDPDFVHELTRLEHSIKIKQG